MLSTTIERLRSRRQGIDTGRTIFYAFVWLVRKASLGTVEIFYKYAILQEVPPRPLLGGRTRGIPEIVALEGPELLAAFERDEDGAFSRPPKDSPRTRRRIERGDLCITAMRSSRAVGTLWLTFDAFDETEVRCDFVVDPEDGVAWDSNLYIVEDARGGLLFAALWDGANAALREKNYRACATMTDAFNGPSLQSHKRLGARRLARMFFFRLGPFQLSVTSLRPRVTLIGPGRRRPVFVVPPLDEALPRCRDL